MKWQHIFWGKRLQETASSSNIAGFSFVFKQGKDLTGILDIAESICSTRSLVVCPFNFFQGHFSAQLIFSGQCSSKSLLQKDVQSSCVENWKKQKRASLKYLHVRHVLFHSIGRSSLSSPISSLWFGPDFRFCGCTCIQC
jgi:hypothetical protein